jgi:arginyl-tRNA synthetase
VAGQATWPAGVARADIAGPGFLNLFLDRAAVLRRLLEAETAVQAPAPSGTQVVEHTNINPNKAAHIGHLRNAVLGDILVRCLRHQGHRVEVQNYIDDTGVQVADVVVGLLYLPAAELAEAVGVDQAGRDQLLAAVIRRMPDASVPSASVADFDDLCWDIYPRVTSRYQEDEALKARRAEVLHAVEEGFGDLGIDQALHLLGGAAVASLPYHPQAVARLAAAVADANLRCHLATMARLGISYDVLPHESDILALGFWSRAFEMLRSAGAIRLESEGKNAGCWVMSLGDSPEFADMDDPDKILVRSNGTVTYTGKDIAYQLWKLGLLRSSDGERQDFGYRPFAVWTQSGPASPVVYLSEPAARAEPGGTVLARTAAERGDASGTTYGAGERVFNVIDVRQSYPQKVVREAVRVLGFADAADSSIHFSYEMVALTPAAVRLIEERTGADLGLSAEEMSKAYVEMSGRRGIGVRADEFLDILIGAAAEAVAERLPEPLPEAELAVRSRAIAVGALRYLMARQSRTRVLAFDFSEALAFEGDTGPYLQYSAVRARKIFDRLLERRGEGRVGDDELELLDGLDMPDDLWALVLECARRDETVSQAVDHLEFSLLAQHVHELAQMFHKLYRVHQIVSEDDGGLRRLRRAVFTLFAREMQVLLEDLLGVPIPEEM